MGRVSVSEPVIRAVFQYLSQCDTVCLLKDGRILESGPHAKLMSDGAEYAALISTYVEEEEQEEAQEGPPDTDVLLEVASSRSVNGTLSGPVFQSNHIFGCCCAWGAQWLVACSRQSID